MGKRICSTRLRGYWSREAVGADVESAARLDREPRLHVHGRLPGKRQAPHPRGPAARARRAAALGGRRRRRTYCGRKVDSAPLVG